MNYLILNITETQRRTYQGLGSTINSRVQHQLILEITPREGGYYFPLLKELRSPV